MASRFPRSIWLGLALLVLPCILLLGVQGYLLDRTTPELREGRAQVVHTFEVIRTAQTLERSMQDAERGQRGYLITGEAQYLLPYRKAVDEVPTLLTKLQHLTEHNPEQQRRLPVLEHHIKMKLDELALTLSDLRTGGIEAARREVLTDRGLDAMHAITSTLDAMIATKNAVLSQQLARVEVAEQRNADAAIAGGVLAVAAAAAGIVIVIRTFQALERADAARYESEARFRLFVESVTDYAIYTLDPEGRVTSWNASAERIEGYRADEILGEHFSRLQTEDDRAGGLPERALETAKREGHFESEGWCVRKDGSRFRADVIVARVLDREGRLAGFAKVTRDVTERVAQAEALDKTRAALAQSQKMEALGQLSGGVAHDFNNVLHVIDNAVDALKRRLGDPDPGVLRLLNLTERNAARAAALTQRILAFSRKQPLEPRAIQPNRLVQDMTELLRQTLGERVAVEAVLSGGAWAISADPNQLETAILNLAVNARDAMPAGGKLTVETANVLLDEAYAAAHESEEVNAGQYVMIAVSDTGTGMTKEAIARAFEPFFTTKEVGRGTGLGLSQVYGFIKQSGGHVKIYSEAGEGTTVKLYLPRLADGDGPASVPEARPVASTATRETLLVVEDDEDVRVFTADGLRELGYRVLEASEAASALAALEAEPEIDLLFTDLGLPGGMNGRQLADAAAKRRPRLGVLFTTAAARNAIVHHGRLDPGVELIVKPFTQAALAKKVRRVLDRKKG